MATQIEKRIEVMLHGLPSNGQRGGMAKLVLKNMKNTITICDYIDSQIYYVNASEIYRSTLLAKLIVFSKFFGHEKDFDTMTKTDVLSYLNSLRKSEEEDPKHRWIGYYNQTSVTIRGFFRWLYSPEIKPKERPYPVVVDHLPQIKRKEQSTYDPTDMWDDNDTRLFVKYCPFLRDKTYAMMAWDTGARPHELLKLRMKSINFELSSTGIQYAVINMRGGKTGDRTIPLIESIPYVKQWWNEHPMGNNPENIFLCGFGQRAFGKKISVNSLSGGFRKYKLDYFPKLLDNPDIPEIDKDAIRKLLTKPWNPYVFRHSGLTRISMQIKEAGLRQHAGWTQNSKMPSKYLHYFGRASTNELLKATGVIPKDIEQSSVLKPKQCPNCNESNNPNSRFCQRCRLILSYDGYNETLGKQAEHEEEMEELKDKMRRMEEAQRNIVRGYRATADLVEDPSKAYIKMEKGAQKTKIPYKKETKEEMLKRHAREIAEAE